MGSVYDGETGGAVRRVNIHLEEEIDDRLRSEAARRGMPKAALIRHFVARGLSQSTVDPVDLIIGVGDGDDVDDIDAAVYDT
jgi:hypothetical protein